MSTEFEEGSGDTKFTQLGTPVVKRASTYVDVKVGNEWQACIMVSKAPFYRKGILKRSGVARIDTLTPLILLFYRCLCRSLPLPTSPSPSFISFNSCRGISLPSYEPRLNSIS